jgi:hypothetical protein
MIARAWVLRCDDCGKVEMVYTETRSVAVQTAMSHNWIVNGKMCYCLACSMKRSGRTL